MNRRYYRFDIVLVSPLSLSSGLNENTDSDVLLDSRGKPYIPATSLAGVLSSRLDNSQKEELYGKISPDGKSTQSKVIFYDAELSEDSLHCVSVRDSVALENKVGVDGAKFDFEIIESGACFIGYIELEDDLTDAEEVLLKKELSALDSGTLRLGHKTTRGYGRVRLRDVKRIAFTDTMAWLDFDMYDYDCWKEADTVELKIDDMSVDSLHLELTLKSALSIRSYTTELPDIGETTAPDYKYLSLHDDTPVIPGTTWSGAFRDRAAQLLGADKLKDQDMKKLFGYVDSDTNTSQKSNITFSESIFEKGSYEKKLITRNSIDRFSAATNDGALYTELTIYGGKTCLDISFRADTKASIKAVILAVIADLDNGFLSVGGLTSVGRGLFSVDKLLYNGSDVTDKFKAYDFQSIARGEIQ